MRLVSMGATLVRRRLIAVCGAVLLVLAVVAAGSFFLGDTHALDSLTIKRVTPSQVSAAMAADHFYSDYRASTLLVTGTAASITRSGSSAIVTFATGSPFKTLCDFANYTGRIRVGDSIKAISETALAERQPSAVLLKDSRLHNSPASSSTSQDGPPRFQSAALRGWLRVAVGTAVAGDPRADPVILTSI